MMNNLEPMTKDELIGLMLERKDINEEQAKKWRNTDRSLCSKHKLVPVDRGRNTGVSEFVDIHKDRNSLGAYSASKYQRYYQVCIECGFGFKEEELKEQIDL